MEKDFTLSKEARLSVQKLKKGELCEDEIDGFHLLRQCGFIEPAYKPEGVPHGVYHPDTTYRLSQNYARYAAGRGIRDDARVIGQFIAEKVIQMRTFDNAISVSYEQLVTSFGFEDYGYCDFCIQYLIASSCLEVENPLDPKDGKSFSVFAKSKLIDFLANVC